MRRNSKYIAYFCSILICTCACYQSETFEPNLNNIISIEGQQSDSLGRALILENNVYPCVVPGRCEPNLVKDALLYLSGGQSGRVDMTCDNTCSIYYNPTPTSYQAGDEITMTVSLRGEVYEASGVMPEALDMVLATRYDLDANFPGLLIKLDTIALAQSNGLYLQFFTTRSVSINYGFLITSDRFASSRLPNNGQYVAPDEYYISNEEINLSGITVFPDDQYFVIARHITPESANYYRAFKEILATGNINLNNGLLFAPPENLPTNFDNGGFGFYHIYYEQVVLGEVQ